MQQEIIKEALIPDISGVQEAKPIGPRTALKRALGQVAVQGSIPLSLHKAEAGAKSKHQSRNKAPRASADLGRKPDSPVLEAWNAEPLQSNTLWLDELNDSTAPKKYTQSRNANYRGHQTADPKELEEIIENN